MSYAMGNTKRIRWWATIALGAWCLLTASGCGRCRLPAIDPYGNRIFLPAPNYTTAAPRGQFDNAMLEPAFQAPPSPPPCPPGFPNAPAPQPYSAPQPYAAPQPYISPQPECGTPRWGWMDDCDPRYEPDCDYGWEPSYEYDPFGYRSDCNSYDSAYLPEDYPGYDDCYAFAPAYQQSDGYLQDPCYQYPCYQYPCYQDLCYQDLCYQDLCYQDPCYQDPCAVYPPPVPATTAVPTYGPQTYQPPPVQPPPVQPQFVQPQFVQPQSLTGPPVLDTRAARHGMRDGELLLEPKRLVASVGREVVLRAGICGEDGYLIKRQPIEFSLSQESVGTIVEVDNTSQHFLRRLFRRRPERTSTNFAVGRTSLWEQVLARGTVDPSDDIRLAVGQTWVSVSSESEGVTHVTALGPTTAGWNQRRSTASIHWVDGQWTFPPPSISGATSGQIITTKLVRASNGTPIEGWRVQYAIAGGTPAALDAERTPVQVVDVKSDENGDANVMVVPQSGQGGTTLINMKVIRVGTGPGDLAKLTVGEGSTSVTWTAPALSVSISGPTQAQVGGQVTYQISATNTGRSTATDVDILDTFPTGLQYLDSQPPSEPFGDRLRWSIGDLAPGQTETVIANFKVTSGGTLTNCAQATMAGGVEVEDCTAMQIVEQSVSITVNDLPPVRVGESVDYQITITNRSARQLGDAVLVSRFDDSLTHLAGVSPLEMALQAMQPNSQQSQEVRFTAAAPGQACTIFEVHVAESIVTTRTCVDISGGITPPPVPGTQALTVTMRGAESLPVGGEHRINSFNIANNTAQDLYNIDVVYQYANNVKLTHATETVKTGEQSHVGNELRWVIPSLPRGHILNIQVACETLSAGRACNTVIVRAPDEQNDRSEFCTEVVGDAAAPSAQPGVRGEARPGEFDTGARDGSQPISAHTSLRIPDRLQVTLERSNRLLNAPHESVFDVAIHNPRNTPASRVVLTVRLPDGYEFIDSKMPPRIDVVRGSGDGRQIEFSPLLDLRADETVHFQIIAAGTGADDSFSASVKCEQLETPIVVRGYSELNW